MEKSRSVKFGRFAAFLFVVWIGVMVVGMNAPSPSNIESISESKRTEPRQLSYPGLDGDTWNLNAHRGKVVLVNYWATWCGPCQKETPALVNVANAFKSQGLEMVGVSMDQGNREMIDKFVKAFSIPYPIAMGTEDPGLAHGIPLPTTLVFDRKGRLAAKAIGEVELADLNRNIKQLLSER